MSDQLLLALSRSSKPKILVLHFTNIIENPLLVRDDPELRAEDGRADGVKDLWHDRPVSFSAFHNLARLTLLNIFGELSYRSS